MTSGIDRRRLTELASCAGCAAKMGPDRLAQALLPLAADDHPDLLVGLQTSDDAAVYRIAPDLAIVQTLDFFPPIVDDPHAYGAIAAANAMSDVYAMNGSVLLALSVAAFPADLPIDTITDIFSGAAEKVREAGGIIAGGHTVLDEEPKFGLSVTGHVQPNRVWTKAGALPGDILVLTKPLGTGFITTALKNGRADARHVEAAIASMLTLNRAAQEAATDLDVHACSDITGFSMVGHASEMASKSGVHLEIEADSLPLLEGALQYAADGNIAGGLLRNQAHFEGDRVHVESHVDPLRKLVCFDPQTSGGLLLSVAPASMPALIERYREASIPWWVVGRVAAGAGVRVI